MTISDNYNLADIILHLETTLQIDGGDYGERDIDVIMKNIYLRIQRQYQIDLTNTQLTDESLYIGPTRESAILLIDNVSQLHARLSGYLQIIRYRRSDITEESIAEVHGSNVNYFSMSIQQFADAMRAFSVSARVTQMGNIVKYLGNTFATVSNNTEKRLLLLLLVSYKFGLYEITSAIAEIFIIGELIK